jgi:hypothetical protein
MALKNSRGWWIPLVGCGIAASLVFVAYAQSLGDLARLEEARRKALKGPVKVYTNESLPAGQNDAPPPGQASDEAKPASDAGARPAPGAAAAGTDKPAAPPVVAQERTPEFWQKRIGDAREQRKRNAMYLEALQTRVNALWADFTARDDPAQRALIGVERQKALDELDRLKKDQDDLDKKIAAIEEEARKAGVPPGWLR